MRNIFSEQMSNFIGVFQIFSLFPCSTHPIMDILLVVYSIIHVLIIFAIFASAFFINSVLEDNNALSLLVGGLVFVGLLITHFINIFQALLTRKKQNMIYQKFDEIDFLLQNQLLVNINYKSLQQKLFIKYFIIKTLLITIHISSIVSVIINQLFIQYYLHLILPVFIIRIRCIQNMFYVDLINEKLNLMNQKLEDINSKHRDKMAFILFADKMQKFDRKDTKNSLYEQLLVLKQIYGKLWDVSNLINDCFGWSLLVIVTQYFIEFTSNGYWLFLALENVLDRSIATQSLCSIFPIIIILTSMAYSCYQSAESAQHTGVLIHKIERDISNDLQNALVS